MSKWPFWRKTMFAGAIWLLGVSIATPALDTPGPLAALAYAAGYGTLMTGFYFAMRDRREQEPHEPRPESDEDSAKR